jgi:cholesterol transport system auxiliary component
MRTLMSAGLVASLLAALGACLSLEVGTESSTLTQFRLEDQVSAQAPRARPLVHRLVIFPMPAGTTAESYSLLYSKAPQARAAYQFAGWTERPSQRLAQLLVDRLVALNSFESVALLGRGVGGDLQLNLIVVEIYHDAASVPGSGRVVINAELVERESRRLLARETFATQVPVDSNTAAGAVRALSRASGQALDQLVPWLERSAETAAPAPTSAAR